MDNIPKADQEEKMIVFGIGHAVKSFQEIRNKIVDQDNFDNSRQFLESAIFDIFKKRYDNINDPGLYKTMFLNVLRTKQDVLFAQKGY